MTAPYPGLHPELWDIVRAMGDGPDIGISINALREQVATEDAGKSVTLPPGIAVQNGDLQTPDRQVPWRTYEPADVRGTMLYLHGGGWVLGELVEHQQLCADLSAATGLRIVSLDYALSPEHQFPLALREACFAFEALRKQFAGPLWIGGDSAGGNLALCCAVAIQDDDEDYADGLFLIYPAIDPTCSSPSFKIHAAAPDLSAAWMRRFWVEYLGDKPTGRYNAPPMDRRELYQPVVLLTAELDPLVAEGNAIATHLVTERDELWHEEGRGLIHGFLRMRDVSPACEAAFQRACAAINRFNSAARRDPDQTHR